MKAIVFASHDVPATFRAASELVMELSKARIPAELVDKLSSDRTELWKVVAYGVVEPAVLVLYDESGIRYRTTALPSAADVRRVIDDILT